jgi:hypothetical protein
MQYTRTLFDLETPRLMPSQRAPVRTGARITTLFGVALLLGVTAGVYALSRSTKVAGPIYAAGFILLTWSRPGVALGLIVASAPFQYDVSGDGPMRFSIAEINLALSIPMWLLGSGRPRGRARAWGLGLSLVGYFAIAIISSLLHWHAGTAVSSLLQMWLYMVAAVGVFASLGKRPEYYVDALLGLLAVCIFLAISAHGMRGGEVLGGLHKNGIGASLAAGVVIGVELWFSKSFNYSKRFVAVATLFSAAGLILSLSRGSWLAAATGVLFILAMRRQFRLFWKVCFALIPAVAVAWFILPPESKEYALNFDKGTGASISARYENIAFARKHFLSSPVLGVGVGLRKEFDATNIFWVTLAETGVVGAAMFILIQVSIVMMVVKLRRVVGPGDPRFTFVVLAGALVMGRFAHGMFDHYWSRGAIMIAWACVGMLVHVYGEAFLRGGQRNEAVLR